jgi:Flp pilus assembly protein TadG
MDDNSTWRDSDRSERGQTIVEFALVVSFLFLIIFGIVEFSRLFFSYATMSHGTREAARWGIVRGQRLEYYANPPQLRQEVEDEARERMFLVGNTVEITAGTPDVVSGTLCAHDCRLVVTATSQYNPWFPFVPEFTILARTTMHFE